jgi:two-component system cell cycle response regulator
MKILAAEDNPVFQTTLRTILTKWGYEVILAKDGDEAWSALQADCGPRLAILDWMMPGLDGPEVCRRLRAANREPYVYVLLLTARAESQDLVEGMEAGADDYLTKPLRVPELRARLRAGRRIVDLQEELMLAREALRQQATHDGLTGLLNRSAILEVLHNEVARAQRENQILSILMVDLDHFKQVNDEFGHLAGDAVLREASSRMRAVVRRYDSVGRYGGEEFLVVLPGCDSVAAAAQAERLCLALSAAPFVFGNGTCSLTGSVGYVCSTDVPAGHPVCWLEVPTSESLIRLADAALYDAKNRGRNRSASAQTEMNVR